ncbi:MAG: hypothetical protein HY520_03480 [Candidatus Aenigmarchaeota archaeon]|nr:hypothetical protein [Candidatus Aenigmarchaeota archaeon]
MDPKPRIIVDHRERDVLRALRELAEVDEQQLAVGDFICSERVGVERKAIEDFLTSLMDQRLFSQMEALAGAYDRPLLIMEGNPDLLFLRNIHQNAIRGALASIAIDYKVPIIWTSSSQETAQQLYWIANREQLLGKRVVGVRGKRPPSTLQEQQLFLVAGLPGISRKRAELLLRHFKTPEKVFKASAEEIQEIDGFGEKMAGRIRDILRHAYGKEASAR